MMCVWTRDTTFPWTEWNPLFGDRSGMTGNEVTYSCPCFRLSYNR